MDIQFKCPRCGQKLCVEESGAGMIVDCPACKGQIEIPRHTVDKSEYHAPLRSEQATDAQKGKLRFYRVRFSDNMTKAEASNLIDDAMARYPEKEQKYQEWKQAEEDFAYWYLQAVKSDLVGNDMGMPTPEMVRETIGFLNVWQPDWRQEVSGGNGFSRFLIARYPNLQNGQAIEAARIADSTVGQPEGDFREF